MRDPGPNLVTPRPPSALQSGCGGPPLTTIPGGIMRKTVLALSVLAGLIATPALAQSRAIPGPASLAAPMDSHLSAFGILNYWYGTGTGLGVGVRYQKTMVPEGVLKNDKIKDD